MLCTGALPLASLRLMASPLQLTYSYIWQVIRQRNVKLYGKVEEFVAMVTQTVPELMTFKQTAQLILGLRARVRVYQLKFVRTVSNNECNSCKGMEIIIAIGSVRREVKRIRKINYIESKVQEHHCIVL